MFEYQIDHRKDLTLVTLVGDLVYQSHDDLRRETRDFWGKESNPVVVLDLTAVTDVDAAGQGYLIDSFGKAALSNKNLVLVGLPSESLGFFKLVGPHKVLDIYANLDEARARYDF